MSLFQHTLNSALLLTFFPRVMLESVDFVLPNFHRPMINPNMMSPPSFVQLEAVLVYRCSPNLCRLMFVRNSCTEHSSVNVPDHFVVLKLGSMFCEHLMLSVGHHPNSIVLNVFLAEKNNSRIENEIIALR